MAAWVSDAGIAEVSYTAFASRKGQAITARLIVRRVKDLNRKAAEGQDELFAVWRFDIIGGDTACELVEASPGHTARSSARRACQRLIQRSGWLPLAY